MKGRGADHSQHVGACFTIAAYRQLTLSERRAVPPWKDEKMKYIHCDIFFVHIYKFLTLQPLKGCQSDFKRILACVLGDCRHISYFILSYSTKIMQDGSRNIHQFWSFSFYCHFLSEATDPTFRRTGAANLFVQCKEMSTQTPLPDGWEERRDNQVGTSCKSVVPVDQARFLTSCTRLTSTSGQHS